jgi:creatinine amidohydrolase
MLLPEMTWEEVQALDRRTIVIAPFGAMEQHGPHLPLQTDALIGSELARRLDSLCGDRLLILPTQWLGLSTHHMKFAGTISASVETYLTMAMETLASLVQAGFEKFILLNSHGGNLSALDVVLAKCRQQYPHVRMVLVTYWNVAAADLQKLRESAVGGMGHAGELETSLVLAIRPGLVRTEHLRPDGGWSVSRFLGKDMLSGGCASVSRSFSEISTAGAVGDPRTASAEKGESFFRVIITQLADLVRDLESGEIDELRPVGA